MGGGRLAFFSLRMKWKCLWAFLVMEVVFVVQVRSATMCTPRSLVLLTLSTAALWVFSGVWLAGLLLKSTVISFVFSTQRQIVLFTLVVSPLLCILTHPCCDERYQCPVICKRDDLV
ncbi:hypothetical protein LDENG_00199090 [Lucifuga dentata]|nr:hypothetical protein LDENG_00199090 [Lucifuga dentata]